MRDGRRTIATKLSRLAQGLPAHIRQEFRLFLGSLEGNEPKPKKRHSWKVKGKRKGVSVKTSTAPRKVNQRPKSQQRQMSLPLGEE